jgi:hypothetical protein
MMMNPGARTWVMSEKTLQGMLQSDMQSLQLYNEIPRILQYLRKAGLRAIDLEDF